MQPKRLYQNGEDLLPTVNRAFSPLQSTFPLSMSPLLHAGFTISTASSALFLFFSQILPWVLFGKLSEGVFFTVGWFCRVFSLCPAVSGVRLKRSAAAVSVALGPIGRTTFRGTMRSLRALGQTTIFRPAKANGDYVT